MNPKDQDPADSVYEFVCVDCGVTERRRLTAGNEVPECGCGSPLWPVARLGDSSAEPDVCGEAFLDKFRQESTPPADRHEGSSLGLAEGGSRDKTSAPEPEYGSLDHPHVEPNCPFCAMRQHRPSQHRVWCTVFFTGECDCGYQRR
jgi:hypothetical protein